MFFAQFSWRGWNPGQVHLEEMGHPKLTGRVMMEALNYHPLSKTNASRIVVDFNPLADKEPAV